MSKEKPKREKVTGLFKCPKCGKRVNHLIEYTAVMRGTIKHCEDCDKKFWKGQL